MANTGSTGREKENDETSRAKMGRRKGELERGKKEEEHCKSNGERRGKRLSRR